MRNVRACLFVKSLSFLVVSFAMTICIAFTGCSDPRSDKDVLVFAAASSNEAISEICREFESQDKEARIRKSFAGSSTLATQILNGAHADVFLSANLQWVEKLRQHDLVADVNMIVGNQLVVITSTNQHDWQPEKLEDLLDERVRRISIANPDSVPAGIYSKNSMEQLEIWQSVKPKLIYGSDVRQTLSQVENSAVDFGLVYRTDANISSYMTSALNVSDLDGAPVLIDQFLDGAIEID
ncbi:MAG: molybdate ABC transporter substrate-binding protein, partial [Planctomycetota bacterium]